MGIGEEGLCFGLDLYCSFGVLSSFAIILLRKRYGCFALIVFLLSFDNLYQWSR